MKTIATSSSKDCLIAYLSTCHEPLKSFLFVETGHIYRLMIDEENWESIPKETQTIVEARVYGFIEGWEYRESW